MRKGQQHQPTNRGTQVISASHQWKEIWTGSTRSRQRDSTAHGLQEDSLQGDSVQMSSKEALWTQAKIYSKQAKYYRLLFGYKHMSKVQSFWTFFAGYDRSTSVALLRGAPSRVFTHQSAVQLCSTISLTFLLYSRLFSLNMRAASEFAGELGFGSQSNDCIREKVDISRLFKQIQMHSL